LKTEELCIGAVKQNPDALRFVPDEFKAICVEATE
jgi:hypothetical protein